MISLNSLLRIPYPLVLASQSPRRSSLLRHVGFTFTTISPNVDEEAVSTSLPPNEYVQQLARMKASRGAELTADQTIVIGSDTTVVLDGVILNKPLDEEHAVRMLQTLSGRTHTVYTGVALAVSGQPELTRVAYSATDVTFRELDSEEIAAYVQSGSPMDKAGAYGIQDDFGAVFVSRVEGCYYTIVGLPLELLYTTMRDLVREISNA